MFEDNQGAIALAENPMSAGRTKHMDVMYHFIRELVEKKVLRMVYRKTEEQPADVSVRMSCLYVVVGVVERCYLLSSRESFVRSPVFPLPQSTRVEHFCWSVQARLL